VAGAVAWSIEFSKTGFLGLLCLTYIAATARARSAASASPIAFTRNAAPSWRAGRWPDHPLGFTGREEVSQAYVFARREFLLPHRHNEEGAGLIIFPLS